MHISLDAGTQNEKQVSVEDLQNFVKVASNDIDDDVFYGDDIKGGLMKLFSTPCIRDLLIQASRSDVFGHELSASYAKDKESLILLRCVKQLKYSYNVPLGQLVNVLATIVKTSDQKQSEKWNSLVDRVLADEMGSLLSKDLILAKEGKFAKLRPLYEENSVWLESKDPHAIYPTSIYRNCSGHVSSSDDSKVIEGVMGTTITTTIEIVRDVLRPENHQLRDVYKPLRRCVTVIDERVDGYFGKDLEAYFNAHNIPIEKLVYRAMEVDKDISTVEKILVDLKAHKVSRNEPILVVGGGVMADVGGFACALYHRNTPYVMLCTSIVSGIDAGPSPRTCCDGLGYKNIFGAYHPPILTLTDRSFFRTLHHGWIRHGIAEIIKMAVVKDFGLFQLVEEAGGELVKTKFGIEQCERGSRIDELSEQIIAKAMDCYVRSEYGNLWETHQCRPHAYGHTWSPGFEIQAGLLHGHAVACGMGYGAYLSFLEGWISEDEMHRVLRLIASVDLSIYHPVLENYDLVWGAQVKMTEKRGGNLCAPIPKGTLGKCGYLNDMTRERLEKTLSDYKKVCSSYPREGMGVEPHCRDVGLEDPSTVKQHIESNGDAQQNGSADKHANGSDSSNTEYNAWLESQQKQRNQDNTSSKLTANLLQAIPDDMPAPPSFPHSTLFRENAEEYAMSMTSLASKSTMAVARRTNEASMFAPCMVGQIEGQLLKMLCRMKRAKRVLDIGTFTGYSAMAFAEGLDADGEVVTIENDPKYAEVARASFDESPHKDQIKSVIGDAKEVVKKLSEAGEKFDIVFLDADKVNYQYYYEYALKLTGEDGVIMADNALCSLVYTDDDPAKQKLHEFAQFVRRDDRVEQVMMTVREGILLVQKKGAY
eukprot:Plantae.Rhodophyta-Purpureofilum_apyrenoidigerum.ctg5009.p1 GENE.Plantae.Rhodophyta-Purpureofilum_apyrenoidigerum.ctg5009~~Plantae.Rhodophyta-Purpureofilum_apyrenoidigerum.ctg5009.p1  ORF type:complete len:876 (-),score=200.40 Plantae.Rhodophyta-Purpureofilum_apyrenoidigerum.ctg5009:642-3269(-)